MYVSMRIFGVPKRPNYFKKMLPPYWNPVNKKTICHAKSTCDVLENATRQSFYYMSTLFVIIVYVRTLLIVFSVVVNCDNLVYPATFYRFVV